ADPEYYKIFPLSKENFKPIKEVESGRKIAFVDGGNQEVLGAANFSIQINRVYFNIFDGEKRILKGSLPNRVEFFSVTYSSFRNGEIFYDTSLFALRDSFKKLLPSESDLSFSSSDRTVMIGTMRADISRVASIARRFAEWSYAFHIVNNELEKGDVIMLDGSLQTAFTNESRYSNELYKIAKSKEVIVTGLSKTCRLLTNTGLSLLGAVSKLADETPYNSWYFPVAEAMSPDHNAIIYVIKLSPKAERIFRFEIYREQFLELGEREVDEVFSQLAKNSQDVSFPGYPYGLIDADNFSRVGDDEVEEYKILLLSEISKQGKWSKFAKYIRTVDAHAVLNMLGGT
ncbi:MAG: DNA double-strand break repair nuclease NurA, partial [Nitrososphaeria archaeon]|nr:DNA double-strand break repair nuclease NurA [Nitrososphaeria archaeon]